MSQYAVSLYSLNNIESIFICVLEFILNHKKNKTHNLLLVKLLYCIYCRWNKKLSSLSLSFAVYFTCMEVCNIVRRRAFLCISPFSRQIQVHCIQAKYQNFTKKIIFRSFVTIKLYYRIASITSISQWIRIR